MTEEKKEPWEHNESMRKKYLEALAWLRSRGKWVLEGGKVNWVNQQMEAKK